jgi:outer membrane receptor protein involved in Fe transport
LRYQLNDYLYFDADANYTYARSIDEPDGQNYIPLCTRFHINWRIKFSKWYGLSGGLRYRYLKVVLQMKIIIVAKGYFVSDLNINYDKSVTFGVSVENLLNTKWNETQFATESRLKKKLIVLKKFILRLAPFL